MMNDVSDEILNAWLDDELDSTERTELIERIAADDALRSRACELWQIKQMVRGAYPLPKQTAYRPPPSYPPTRWVHALAATLLLTFGATSGWFMHDRLDTEGLAMHRMDELRADGGKVVLHLFSDEPARMEAALRMAEQLADARDRSGRPFRVDFITNGPGLHLMRVGGSPHESRLAALVSQHDNLNLIACQRAMDRMRDRGIDVVLLPMVKEAVSAESRLAERLTQGWRYVQA